MLRVSVLGLVLELFIAASTLLPGAPAVPQWPQFVLFPFIFVVHFSSVLRLAPTGGRFRWRDQVVGVPPVLIIAFFVLFAVVAAVAIPTITSLGGQPTIVAGHYFLNDHGHLISVTRAGYDHAQVLQQRVFTLIPSVFFALGVLIHFPTRISSQLAGRGATAGDAEWFGGSGRGSESSHDAERRFSEWPAQSQLSPSVGSRRRQLLYGGVAAGGLAALAVVVIATHLNDSCSTAGISTAAGREGVCTRYSGFFAKTTYNVVDAGHVLHMPGYDAQLLATQVSTTTVSNPQSDPFAYPNGRGLLVSFEISVTNDGRSPLMFDSGGKDVALLLDDDGLDSETSFPDLPNAIGEPGQAIADDSPLQPGQTATGWVSIVAPAWTTKVLNKRPSDLDFFSPDHGTSYIGQIRLWKAANPQGQQALTAQ